MAAKSKPWAIRPIPCPFRNDEQDAVSNRGTLAVAWFRCGRLVAGSFPPWLLGI